MSVLRRMNPWLAPVALMALIFALSAQPNLNSGLGWIDHVGRKVVHASEYAVLCFLWWRALRTVRRHATALLCALAIATVYAATDEFHQRFVSGRHSTWTDVVIDFLGATLAATLIERSRRTVHA